MIYLVPTFLAEDATETIPPYVTEAVKSCTVIFAENIRTARRFIKAMDRQISIDDFEWFEIHKAEASHIAVFRQKVKEGKQVAIISEAGCPGIADPGQLLVAEAQQLQAEVKPLVGPSSVLLALMASGLNGQQFYFHGYLPIDQHERIKKIKQIEEESYRRKCTQVFIETPYRNTRLLETILQHCRHDTQLCIAADITSPYEFIRTKTIAGWQKEVPDINKRPVIFLLSV